MRGSSWLELNSSARGNSSYIVPSAFILPSSIVKTQTSSKREMLTWSNGTRFIGYGATVQCPKCHNRVVEQIYIRFDETGFAFIPIWTGRYDTESMCHICHTILDPTELLAGNSRRLDTRLNMMLEETLGYAQKLTWLQRRTYLNDLRSLGLADMRAFIESRCA